MTSLLHLPGSRPRSLFLVATDVAGRVSILAGPYATVAQAAGRAPAVAAQLADVSALATFGHVTVAEGAATSPTFFGRV